MPETKKISEFLESLSQVTRISRDPELHRELKKISKRVENVDLQQAARKAIKGAVNSLLEQIL
jgi:hypothetical protein